MKKIYKKIISFDKMKLEKCIKEKAFADYNKYGKEKILVIHINK